jgi:hypothetical protein
LASPGKYRSAAIVFEDAMQFIDIVARNTKVSTQVKNKAGFFVMHGSKLSGRRVLIFKSGGKKFLMTVNVAGGGKTHPQECQAEAESPCCAYGERREQRY